MKIPSTPPHFFRPGLLAVTFLCMTGAVSGQFPGNPNAGEEPKTIHFRVMAMRDIVRDIAFLQDGKAETFNVSRSRATKWMTYRGIGPLNFYRSGDLAHLENLEGLPQPVAQFTPPDSGSWLLIFVKTGSDGAVPEYRAFPIPDEGDTVEEGIRFYNLTDKRLGVNVNDETVQIRSRGRVQINPGPREDSSMFMRIAAEENDGWKIVSSTVFGHRPGARISFFILEDEGRILFQRFVDPVGPVREPDE